MGTYPNWRLKALLAKKYAITAMPVHQPRAIQISLPTDPSYNNARIAFTIEVTGWFSANARTILGMVSVGTKAELINGRKINGYE